MKILKYIPLMFALLMTACSQTPEIDNATMLDGDQIFDLSLSNPKKYLISDSLTNPTEKQKNKPVIICAHGYTATTFEWDELRTFADSAQTFNVSQVLLGGHGKTYEDFKNSTWKDWQSSIYTEYHRLDSLGFRNIYLAGSSTGGPLVINLIQNSMYDESNPPKGYFLVDPIVVSSNKMLTMVEVVGPVLGYTTVTLSAGEQGHWYVYRPYQTLQQLMNLIDITRKGLEKGITLPEGAFMKTYKSIKDDSADPVSAVLIYKGMKTSDGGKTQVKMVNSDIHVFTRLDGRDNVTSADRALQQETFRDMENLMIGNQ